MGNCPGAASVAYAWITGGPTSSTPDWNYDDVALSDEDDDLLDLDFPNGSVKLSRGGSRVSSSSPYGSDVVVFDDHFNDDRLRMDEDSLLEDSSDEASRHTMASRSAPSGRQSLSQAAATAAAVAQATNAVVGRQPELFSAPVQTQPTGRSAQIGSFVSSIFRREAGAQRSGTLRFASAQQPPSREQAKTSADRSEQPTAELTSTADLTSWIDDPRQLRDISYSYQDDEEEEDFDSFLESVRATTLMGVTRSSCSTPDTEPVNRPHATSPVTEQAIS